MGKVESHWGEANQELRRELRSTLDQVEIQNLHNKHPWLHMLVAARQFVFLVVSTWLLIEYSNPLVVVPAALLSGFTVFNFTVLLHEQLHNLVFANHHQRLNSMLGKLYAFWSGISASQFTRWHLDHHVQLGSDTKDPKTSSSLAQGQQPSAKTGLFHTCSFLPVFPFRSQRNGHL